MWNRGDKTWHLTTVNPALVASADYLISHNISHHQTSTSQKLSAPQAIKTSYLQKKVFFETASLCCFQNERISTWCDHHQHPHARNNDHQDRHHHHFQEDVVVPPHNPYDRSPPSGWRSSQAARWEEDFRHLWTCENFHQLRHLAIIIGISSFIIGHSSCLLPRRRYSWLPQHTDWRRTGSHHYRSHYHRHCQNCLQHNHHHHSRWRHIIYQHRNSHLDHTIQVAFAGWLNRLLKDDKVVKKILWLSKCANHPSQLLNSMIHVIHIWISVWIIQAAEKIKCIYVLQPPRTWHTSFLLRRTAATCTARSTTESFFARWFFLDDIVGASCISYWTIWNLIKIRCFYGNYFADLRWWILPALEQLTTE